MSIQYCRVCDKHIDMDNEDHEHFIEPIEEFDKKLSETLEVIKNLRRDIKLNRIEDELLDMIK